MQTGSPQDNFPSVLVQASTCLVANEAQAHVEKILPRFREELARFPYSGRFAIQVGFNERRFIHSGEIQEVIFVALEFELIGFSKTIEANSRLFSLLFVQQSKHREGTTNCHHWGHPPSYQICMERIQDIIGFIVLQLTTPRACITVTPNHLMERPRRTPRT